MQRPDDSNICNKFVKLHGVFFRYPVSTRIYWLATYIITEALGLEFTLVWACLKYKRLEINCNLWAD